MSHPRSSRGGLWLGVDLGTQGVRVSGHDDEGRIVTRGRADFGPRAPRPGWMVHRPEEDWWAGTAHAIRAAMAGASGRPIRAVGLCGLFPAACLVDESGLALTEAILYGDTRAWREARLVEERLGIALRGDEVAPRLLWLRAHRPAHFRRAALALGPTGFLALRMTGSPLIDPLTAFSWGGLVNAARDGWDGSVLERLRLPARLFPPITPPHPMALAITPQAAALTGLPAGTPIAAAVTDSFATLVAHRVVHPGDALAYLGSSATLLIATRELERVMHAPAETVGPDAPWRLAAYALNSGLLLEQTRTELCGGADFADLDEAAEGVAPGASGLFVVPHISGRIFSGHRPSERAAFVGLTLRHGRPHLWRALLESVGWLLMAADDAAPETIRTLVAGGGGARSAVWRGMITDMLGRPQRPPVGSGASHGAAFLAAYSMGAVGAFDEIRTRWATDEAAPADPDPERHARYRELLPVWQRLDRVLGELAAR